MRSVKMVTFTVVLASGIPIAGATIPVGGGRAGGVVGGGVGGGGIIGLPRPCPTPTLAVCQQEMQLSGSVCKAMNSSACVNILQNATQDRWNADQNIPGPSAPIGLFDTILPDTMKNSGVLLQSALEPFDVSTLHNAGGVGSDVSYSTMTQTQFVPAAGSPLLDLPGLPPATPTKFTGDGTGVAACGEYVYKKYWDYVRFEEAALSCRSDWLCVYDAFARTAAGDVGLNKPTLYSNDALHNALSSGSVTSARMQVRPQPGEPVATTTQKKNAFFPADVDPVVFSSLITRDDRDAVEANDIGLALAADYAADYTIGDRVTWHVQMHDAQQVENGGAGMKLPEYHAHELRMAAYSELIDQFRALSAIPGPGTGCALDPSMCDACGNVLSYDPITGDPLPTTCKKKGHWVPVPGSTAAALYSVANRIALLLIDEWHHKSYVDGTTVDHGCLATDSARCDWSPALIAAEYLHLGATQREADFRHCLVETEENFTDSQFPSYLPDPNNFVYRDGRADWDAFEAWMGRADIARGEIMKDMPWVGTDTIGASKTGAGQLGDTSLFAASYNYEASWSVHLDKVVNPATGLPQICRSTGAAKAKLVADAWAVSNSFDLVNAVVDMYVGTPGPLNPDGSRAAGDPNAHVSAYLSLLGAPIYTTAGDVPSFDLSPSPASWGVSHSQTVFVGPVPVTLGASVDLSAGFTAHAGGSAPQPADSDCNFDNPTGVQIAANVTPYVRSSAAAYGALGGSFAGFAAEAGVEGHITLVDATVPVNASVQFGGSTSFDGPPVPSVHVTTSTNLDLDFLSGGIVAFAEVCVVVKCFRTEKPLITWNGLHEHLGIWTPLDKDYPIAALQSARPPTPVAPTP